MTPRFAFLGTPAFAASVLEGLLRQGWKPEIVITEPAKPVGRDQHLQPSAVAQLAKQHNLQIATPSTKDDVTAVLQPLNLELAIVVAYGKIIPGSAIAAPKHGIVNVHASLLPKYRGASPIQAAILAGDQETGITYMLIEPTLDTGPIISQITHTILPTTTSANLFEELAAIASQTIVPTLSSYLDDPSKLAKQNDQAATYTKKLRREDGEVVLQSISPIELDRLVRAYTPWPGVYTLEFNQRLIIHKGHLESNTYAIDELQWEGKKPVDSQTFAKAYPNILTQLPQTITLATSRNPISGSND